MRHLWATFKKKQAEATARRWLIGSGLKHVSWWEFKDACTGFGMKPDACEGFLRNLERSGTVRYANGVVSTDALSLFESVNAAVDIAGCHRHDCRIEDLTGKLTSLEKKKRFVDAQIEHWRQTVWARTAAFCAAQLWFFARLTFVDFDWDVMEPITWLTMQANCVAFFAFMSYYRREHTPEVWDDVILTNVARAAYQRYDFDVVRWANIKAELQQLQREREAPATPL
ncbi:Calcium uniporter protein 5 [Diplonema papillatum]|nr:Calcium uniporter protein 5 [Diplonema papillatum]|eukprot:gene9569-14851_t